MWAYNTTSSRNGRNYSGVMVGLDPTSNQTSTTVITTQIVPLIFQMPDGGVFDPTAPDACAAAPLAGAADLTLFQQSPIFLNHAYAMNGVNVGTTQYVDAFQQANFWSQVGGHSYHTLLGATTLSPITVTVSAGLGVTIPPGPGQCGNLGLLSDIDSFDAFVRTQLIPLLAGSGVSSTTFPIFLMSNVVLCGPNFTGCGILGYHGAFGSPVQTYSVSGFDTALGYDAAVGAHEVAEWMDDPLGTNPTPPWGHIGQVGGCQNNLEVGDPLSGTDLPAVTMPNGFSYHLQELAFFSWFMGGPSLGVGGKFSDNGTFQAAARLCGTPHDFNGDGTADVLWRNTGSGDVVAWLMNGGTVTQAPLLASSVPPAWQIAGVGDFNGDGFADVLWRNTGSGDVVAWLMNGGTVMQAPLVASGVPVAWQIAGVGDFNGDGVADLLWRNTGSGDVAEWLMNGGRVTQAPLVASGVTLAWQVAGVGDFNGDGIADVLWRNTGSGDVAEWLMNGGTVTQAPHVASGISLTWQIQ
jgi:hypothetical protein